MRVKKTNREYELLGIEDVERVDIAVVQQPQPQLLAGQPELLPEPALLPDQPEQLP